MTRHLNRQHSDEVEVASALATDKGKARNIASGRIYGKGLFQNNITVLKTGEGIFIPGRAAQKEHDITDYIPCKYCLMRYIKDEVRRHCIYCPYKIESANKKQQVDKRYYVSVGRSILEAALYADNDYDNLKKYALNHMHKDKIASEVKSDNLILR